MKRSLTAGIAGTLGLLLSGAIASAAPTSETFTGFGVHLQGRARQSIVKIGVERWSTDEERDRFLGILRDNGQRALIDALQHAPTIGYIRTANSLGYELKYAGSVELPDGSRQVVVATDRPVRFRESIGPRRSRFYDFSIAEMKFPPGSKGNGKFAPATAISIDPQTHALVIENYGTEPIRLSSITDKKS